MIEIILIFFVGRRVAAAVKEKGLSRWWWATVLLIPVVGFCTAFVAAVVMLSMRVVDANGLTFAILPFYLVAEGLTAFLVLRTVAAAPAGAAGPPPAAGGYPPPPPPFAPTAVDPPSGTPSDETASATGQALAGFCEECGRTVWLLPGGGCPGGHPESSVSGAHWALRG